MMSIQSLVRALVLAFAQLVFAAAALAQPTPPPAGEIRVEPETQPEVPNAGGRAKPANPRASRAAAVTLERPTPDEIAQRMNPPLRGTPLQVAFGRDVPASASEAALHGLLAWETLADGAKVAAVK